MKEGHFIYKTVRFMSEKKKYSYVKEKKQNKNKQDSDLLSKR